jgi:hypothetical protein
MSLKTSSRSLVVVTALGGVLSVPTVAWAADPTLSDCIEANERAIKLRSENKLTRARAEWLVCAAEACAAEIRTACMSHVADVNKAMPTIVFEAKDAAGKDLASVSVTMDGQPLAARLEGTALSIDPGEHAFRFEVAGTPPVQKTFVIAEGVKERHETIVIGTATAPAAPAASPAQATTHERGTPSRVAPSIAADASAPPAVADSAQRDGSWRTVGLIAGATGIVGLAVGSAAGLVASSKWSSARSACGSPTSCANHDEALAERDSATTAATISTVTFVAGGVALAAGAALFILAPKKSVGAVSAAIAPSIEPGGAGMLLRGAF